MTASNSSIVRRSTPRADGQTIAANDSGDSATRMYTSTERTKSSTHKNSPAITATTPRITAANPSVALVAATPNPERKCTAGLPECASTSAESASVNSSNCFDDHGRGDHAEHGCGQVSADASHHAGDVAGEQTLDQAEEHEAEQQDCRRCCGRSHTAIPIRRTTRP